MLSANGREAHRGMTTMVPGRAADFHKSSQLCERRKMRSALVSSPSIGAGTKRNTYLRIVCQCDPTVFLYAANAEHATGLVPARVPTLCRRAPPHLLEQNHHGTTTTTPTQPRQNRCASRNQSPTKSRSRAAVEEGHRQVVTFCLNPKPVL